MTARTRTRDDSRRGRIAARASERDARRDRFRLLLACVERGALSPGEFAQLRDDIGAEIAEHETCRRSAGGQQAAAMRLHKRIEAAEQAIVETEAERDEQAERLAAATKLAGALGSYLPGDGWHLVETVRRLCEGELTPEQALAEPVH
ncbi:hypothetical protein [Streptomyces buecherae]|uniref:Uncharacterized protein n=1 Tax=Streptomyces buecherae TaxID=2763006 RepID=A0A7H8NB38_9ACTN|nr:hypothetical protein [Streptomyces buecherae]QKW51697.1 hypothetical protein HUT08_21660 [Streptomyces buecherae]